MNDTMLYALHTDSVQANSRFTHRDALHLQLLALQCQFMVERIDDGRNGFYYSFTDGMGQRYCGLSMKTISEIVEYE